MEFVITLKDIIMAIIVLILFALFIWYWVAGFIIEIKTRKEKKKEKKQQ